MVAAGAKRARYGTSSLIKRALGDSSGSKGLATSELVARVQDLAGKKIPKGTVFQAAKSLVRRGAIKAVRQGREFRFTLSVGAPTATAASSEPMSAGTPEGALTAFTLPRTLDPGQVAILSHDGRTVVTLTNAHGKAQIERHPIP
jgi:hypothetical protein